VDREGGDIDLLSGCNCCSRQVLEGVQPDDVDGRGKAEDRQSPKFSEVSQG
jgi:hypothetical protein